MPDYFVGLDTTENSSLYSHLIRAGHLNNYSFSYVNKKRDELMGRYSSFQDFKKNFKCLENLTTMYENDGRLVLLLVKNDQLYKTKSEHLFERFQQQIRLLALLFPGRFQLLCQA